MNLLSTFAGSMMEGFLPAGWDLARIDACCALEPGDIGERQGWWHPDFELIACATGPDFDVMMGPRSPPPFAAPATTAVPRRSSCLSAPWACIAGPSTS